jgi:hypothetical protein
MYFDNIERDLDNLRFSEVEYEILDDGFGLLREHLGELMYTVNTLNIYGEADIIEDSVYGAILNIPLCLEKFLSTFQPEAGIF